MTVGATSEDELARIIAAGGRRGEIYAQLKALRDTYADEIRRRYPNLKDVPRRVSGYNLDDLLPERGFHVARALSGTEGTCVTVLEAQVHLVPSPRSQLAARARLSRASTRPATTSPRCSRRSRSAWRGSTTSSSPT